MVKQVLVESQEFIFGHIKLKVPLMCLMGNT